MNEICIMHNADNDRLIIRIGEAYDVIIPVEWIHESHGNIQPSHHYGHLQVHDLKRDRWVYATRLDQTIDECLRQIPHDSVEPLRGVILALVAAVVGLGQKIAFPD